MRPLARHIRPSHLRVWATAALLLTCWLVAGGQRVAHAAPSDLDSTFGTGGKVSTGFGGTGDSAAALVLLPDGKMAAAGGMWSGELYDFALARFNADGSLDPTFGGGTGKVTTDIAGRDLAAALILQPDGKLVAAGVSQTGGVSANFALARYHPNGSLDSTFGTGGKVITDFGGLDLATALILQPDGKLVAAGVSKTGDASFDFALARINADGSLDSTFGTGGKVITDFGGSDDWAAALVLQPDGKLVAAGFSGTDSANFALARYHPNGSLDSTFGTGGKVITDFGGSDLANALVLQPDGKLVAAGDRVDGAETHVFALARYNPNGSLDLTFGGGTGKVITDFDGSASAGDLVVQPDGKLVAAGSYTRADFALVRYHPNGSLDSAFGAGGKVITDIGGPDDSASALVLQPDGKLVAAGVSSANFALARYQGDRTAATRMLTITRTGADSDHRTFLTTDPINVGADYYDPNEACRGVDPATVKFFVFSPEGQLVLGKNRDAASAPTNTVTNSQVGTSKHQALLATLAPGELPAGSYNVVFRVEDCSGTFVLVSDFYSIEVFAP